VPAYVRAHCYLLCVHAPRLQIEVPAKFAPPAGWIALPGRAKQSRYHTTYLVEHVPRMEALRSELRVRGDAACA
jgi:hypothetical protein